MSQKSVIRKGDTTSHGGVVLEGIDNYPIMGTPVACKGHMVSCPKCKGTYPIIEGLPYAPVEGRQMAVEGMKTGCGAELIATQSVHTYEWVPGGTAEATSLVSGLSNEDEAEESIFIFSETKAYQPHNRDRVDIGVGEEVELTADIPIASWVVEPVSMGRIDGYGSLVTFHAYDKAGVAKITAQGLDGKKGSISFTILVPVNLLALQVPKTPLLHIENELGCGFLGLIHVQPPTVNFYNVSIRELDSQAVGTGVYDDATGKWHGGYDKLPDGKRASEWASIAQEDYREGFGSHLNENKNIDRIFLNENDKKIIANYPFRESVVTMPINWEWILDKYSDLSPEQQQEHIHSFPAAEQVHKINADGTMVTSKLGTTVQCHYKDKSSGLEYL